MRKNGKLVCGGRMIGSQHFILSMKWEKRIKLHRGGLPFRFSGFWDSRLVIGQYDLGPVTKYEISACPNSFVTFMRRQFNPESFCDDRNLANGQEQLHFIAETE